MSIEKCISINPENHLVDNFLFKVSLFRFHFVSALQYLDCRYNGYPVKQTASLYLELSLKPAFF